MENMNHNSLAPLCEHASRGRGRNCAFVTILSDYNEGSIKSIVALAKSLTKVNTIFPFLVLLWPHHPTQLPDTLRSQGCILKELLPLFHASHHSAFHNINHSKIHIWKLVEYEKMVYLDPGMLVLANIDNLFDLPNGRIYGPDIITYNGLLNALLLNKPNSFVEQDSKPWGRFGVQLKQWWDILEDDTLEFHHPQNLERLMQSIMDASVTDDADSDSSTILHAPPAA
ncbi:galactinol synthase 2-like [Senna tora]|uniref:Hexosyltransferase n=1 Tax=Senna tora TaxID=362788 RepID=A0A834TK81_9FABA|nr:galactinol synthase 2-like [Senna tora]